MSLTILSFKQYLKERFTNNSKYKKSLKNIQTFKLQFIQECSNTIFSDEFMNKLINNNNYLFFVLKRETRERGVAELREELATSKERAFGELREEITPAITTNNLYKHNNYIGLCILSIVSVNSNKFISTIPYISIKEELRSKGYGSIFISNITNYIMKYYNSNTYFIYLHSIPDSIQFYIKNGFKIISKEEFRKMKIRFIETLENNDIILYLMKIKE